MLYFIHIHNNMVLCKYIHNRQNNAVLHTIRTLTRRALLERMSDFDEIWICYREKNSKVGGSELIGHSAGLGGKKGAWKRAFFSFFRFYSYFAQSIYIQMWYRWKGILKCHLSVPFFWYFFRYFFGTFFFVWKKALF